MVPTQILALLLIAAPPQSESLRLTVEGTERLAVVHPGSKARTEPSPLVFVFHGHGGRAEGAARRYSVHVEWPEATVVYPQGLPNRSLTLGREGPGWQHRLGEDGDRDLEFFDAMMKRIAADYRVDSKRVFACGMSNGALFTFGLLAARPERIAAFALVGGAGGPFLPEAKVPRPILLVFGKNDELVRLAAAERTRDALIRLNGCGREPVEWAKGYVSYEPASGQNRVVWNLHDGGHVWPEGATGSIVRFFQRHPLP